MKYIITLFILITSFNLNSQSIIIAEDVVMRQDSINPPLNIIICKSMEPSKIEKLESQIEELKSQIKELSELLLALILK